MWVVLANRGITHFIALHFIISQILSFKKLKVYGNLVLNKSIDIIFPVAFAHLLVVYHILVILIILQIISLLFYLLS